MEERYKDTTILITPGQVDGKPRWKATCKIKYVKGAQEMVKDLHLNLDYETAEQAERAVMVFAKKWVDAGKPEP